jgi:hypothetical protein
MKPYFRFPLDTLAASVKFLLRFTLLTILIMSCNTKKTGLEPSASKKAIADSVYMQRGNQIVSLTFDTRPW